MQELNLSYQTLWTHKKKRSLYTIDSVANAYAEKEGWPVMVNYYCSDNKMWSLPVETFLEKFKPFVACEEE